jgi:hypothetical protein
LYLVFLIGILGVILSKKGILGVIKITSAPREKGYSHVGEKLKEITWIFLVINIE